MVPNRSGRQAAAAPAWLADSAAAKPAHTGDRMNAAIAAVHLGDLTRRAVLQQLAYRDGPGGARPSFESIGQVLGIHRATVQRHISALGEAGAIWWRQSRGGNEYVLNWPLILSQPCDGLESGNRRIGATVSDSETVANQDGYCRKFDDKPSHSFATQTGKNREPEAIAAAAVRPQATGGGGGNRATMEPESEPEARSAAPTPFAGSRRGASQPEAEPEPRRPARPRHTRTFRADDEPTTDEAGNPHINTLPVTERLRGLIAIYERAGMTERADKARRELASREAAEPPQDARQGSRGASEGTT